MFENNFDNPGNEQNPQIKKWEEQVSSQLEVLWRTHESNQERISVIKEKTKMLAESVLDDPQQVFEQLDACVDIDDQDEFIKAVMTAFIPFRDARFADPKRYEKALAAAFVETSNFTKINELICYDIDGETMHIHVIPNETTPTARKITLLKEGMRGLAQVVQQNETIKKIAGSSWIVAKNPSLVRKLGFTVDGDISDAEREQFFADDEREIYRATMSRQELLSKYL